MSANDWQNNESLKGIDIQKIQMLQEMLGQSSGKKGNEMLPFLIAMSRQANSKGLTFTPEEIKLIVGVLQKDMSPEEAAKANKMMQIMGMM